MKTAVTEEAPAVSERNSNFLPTDENYRLTGEMPAAAERDTRDVVEENRAENREAAAGSDTEHEAVNDDDSAASSETAAASEAATAAGKDKGPAASKTVQTSESRWAKITRENREMRAEIARRKAAETSTATQRDDKPVSQPVTEVKPAVADANAEPKIDDVDAKTGKAKFSTLAEFMNAHSKWNRQEAIREFQTTTAKTERERQQQQTEQTVDRMVNERVAKARVDHPNYDEVAAAALAVKDEHGQDALFYTKGSHLDGFFLDSDRGHDVLHAIFENFDDHKHIFARDAAGKYLLNPVRQLRELAKIELTLPDKTKAPVTSAKPVTQAGRPPNRVDGKGSATKDVSERAIEEMDSETYINEENKKALARLGIKG